MKSTMNKTIETPKTYPGLYMITVGDPAENGTVLLMVDSSAGTVVNTDGVRGDDPYYELGYYSVTWASASLVPFQGEIVLTNN